MTSLGLGRPSLENINNGLLYAFQGVPQKDINSMCDAALAGERQKYLHIRGGYVAPHKKCFGNRDASAVTARHKTAAVGAVAAVAPHKASTHNDINVTRDALARVRGSGYVTTAKVRAKPHNGLTPSWPAGPLFRPVQNTCYYVTPKKVNNTNVYWLSNTGPAAQLNNVVGDPTGGQYTTMAIKQVLPAGATVTDTGLYNRFRHGAAASSVAPTPLYH
jgi:hypothetical protein